MRPKVITYLFEKFEEPWSVWYMQISFNMIYLNGIWIKSQKFKFLFLNLINIGNLLPSLLP